MGSDAIFGYIVSELTHYLVSKNCLFLWRKPPIHLVSRSVFCVSSKGDTHRIKTHGREELCFSQFGVGGTELFLVLGCFFFFSSFIMFVFFPPFWEEKKKTKLRICHSYNALKELLNNRLQFISDLYIEVCWLLQEDQWYLALESWQA